MRAGAKGYVTKHEASAAVLKAIRQILKGEIYLNPRFMSRMISKMTAGGDVASEPIDRLADRELEVFDLIGRGLTTREIAAQLGLGITTVDTYRTRIREKVESGKLCALSPATSHCPTPRATGQLVPRPLFLRNATASDTTPTIFGIRGLNLSTLHKIVSCFSYKICLAAHFYSP
jgi:DNA-binding CsgD family transcriptional regulator